MDNPIVIFIHRDRLHPDLRSELQFPIGWTSQGVRLNGAAAIAGQPCAILALNDLEREIPICGHSNKNSTEPLMIVAHLNSREHRRPQEERAFRDWGRAMVFEGFNHLQTDATFREITELLRNSQNAATFAGNRKTGRLLAVFDEIAALCQLVLIDKNWSSNEFKHALWEVCKNLGDPALADHIRRPETPAEKLRLVQAEAELLLR